MTIDRRTFIKSAAMKYNAIIETGVYIFQEVVDSYRCLFLEKLKADITITSNPISNNYNFWSVRLCGAGGQGDTQDYKQ